MKATLFFVLLCLGLALADDLYIDASATGNSTECSSSDPCVSVAAALAVFGNGTDSLNLFVAPGMYNGAGNTGIVLPAVEVELELNGDGSATFDCGNSNTTAVFSATKEFTVSGIDFSNCGWGIEFDNTDEDLELEDTNFMNVLNAVMFNGEDLSLDNVVINGTATGVKVTNATSLTVTGSSFVGATVASIDYNSVATESVSLSSTTFMNSAVAMFTVGDNNEEFEGTIDSCDFTTVPTAYAIDITNGKWTLENFSITGCETAVSYMSAGNYTELDMDDIDVMTCANGVAFSAPGSLDINGGSYNVSNQAVSISSISSLVIEGTVTITGAATPIALATTDAVNAEISSVTFEATGSVVINAANCNATFSDSSFTNPTGRALDITGGHWGINNVDVTGPVTVAGNGGAFSFSGAGAEFDITGCDIAMTNAGGNGGAVAISGATAAFDTCSFTNCTAAYGGAIFASDFEGLSLESTTFDSNVATNNGGGLDVETTATNATDVYVKDLTFTSNTATTGAAISCCNLQACNITIAEDTEDTVTLTTNTNTATDGSDIACGTDVTPFVTQATQPEVSVESSSSDWLFWLVIILAALLVVGLIVAAGVGVYFYRKRMSYSVVE